MTLGKAVDLELGEFDILSEGIDGVESTGVGVIGNLGKREVMEDGGRARVESNKEERELDRVLDDIDRRLDGFLVNVDELHARLKEQSEAVRDVDGGVGVLDRDLGKTAKNLKRA